MNIDIMKKSLPLILALLALNIATAYAETATQIQAQTDSTKEAADYPEELQKLGKYIDESLDEVKGIDTKTKENCPTQATFAFNAMEMRQKDFDYNDIYYLLSVANSDDLTDKGLDKLTVYKDIFEEAYYYPVYENKDDQDTAMTLYMTYKNHQCLLGVQ